MEREEVVFKGKAGEWFGIWIVNLLLSMATFGIYSAWAKVRRQKYFYNNTYVAGRNFDYHATGKQILIGRIIVAIGFIIYTIMSAIPVLNIVAILILLALLPWLVVRSMMFNARMTSWSNVRFNFAGTVKQAFLVYLIYPILTFLTLYTTIPFLTRAANRFAIVNHRLGSAEFKLDAPIGPFYKGFLMALAWIVASGVVMVMLTGFSFTEFALAMESGDDDPEVVMKFIGLLYLMIFIAILPAAFIYQAVVRNTVYNNAILEGGHRFHSNVSPWMLLWIAVSNLVVVVISLGFMLPWTHIRMMRYLASKTAVTPNGSLDDFVGQQQVEGSAIGDAYTDLEGFDVGLPI